MSDTCIKCETETEAPIVTDEGFMCESCFYKSPQWASMKDADQERFLIRMMKRGVKREIKINPEDCKNGRYVTNMGTSHYKGWFCEKFNEENPNCTIYCPLFKPGKNVAITIIED